MQAQHIDRAALAATLLAKQLEAQQGRQAAQPLAALLQQPSPVPSAAAAIGGDDAHAGAAPKCNDAVTLSLETKGHSRSKGPSPVKHESSVTAMVPTFGAEHSTWQAGINLHTQHRPTSPKQANHINSSIMAMTPGVAAEQSAEVMWQPGSASHTQRTLTSPAQSSPAHPLDYAMAPGIVGELSTEVVWQPGSASHTQHTPASPALPRPADSAQHAGSAGDDKSPTQAAQSPDHAHSSDQMPTEAGRASPWCPENQVKSWQAEASLDLQQPAYEPDSSLDRQVAQPHSSLPSSCVTSQAASLLAAQRTGRSTLTQQAQQAAASLITTAESASERQHMHEPLPNNPQRPQLTYPLALSEPESVTLHTQPTPHAHDLVTGTAHASQAASNHLQSGLIPLPAADPSDHVRASHSASADFCPVTLMLPPGATTAVAITVPSSAACARPVVHEPIAKPAALSRHKVFPSVGIFLT